MESSSPLFRVLSRLIFANAVIDFMSGEFVFSTIVFSIASLGLIGK